MGKKTFWAKSINTDREKLIQRNNKQIQSLYNRTISPIFLLFLSSLRCLSALKLRHACAKNLRKLDAKLPQCILNYINNVAGIPNSVLLKNARHHRYGCRLQNQHRTGLSLNFVYFTSIEIQVKTT